MGCILGRINTIEIYLDNSLNYEKNPDKYQINYFDKNNDSILTENRHLSYLELVSIPKDTSYFTIYHKDQLVMKIDGPFTPKCICIILKHLEY